MSSLGKKLDVCYKYATSSDITWYVHVAHHCKGFLPSQKSALAHLLPRSHRELWHSVCKNCDITLGLRQGDGLRRKSTHNCKLQGREILTNLAIHTTLLLQMLYAVDCPLPLTHTHTHTTSYPSLPMFFNAHQKNWEGLIDFVNDYVPATISAMV